MQSSFSKPTREEEPERILTPHEYIRDSFSFRYQDCISCEHRTEFTCIKCGYCYSCHWKKETAEKRLLEDKIIQLFPSPSYYAGKKVLTEQIVDQQPSKEKRQQQLVIDVYGRTSEAICTYHRCGHKFSAHGFGNCKCSHPTNKTLGVFAKYP
jgi:hypothetical protein